MLERRDLMTADLSFSSAVLLASQVYARESVDQLPTVGGFYFSAAAINRATFVGPVAPSTPIPPAPVAPAPVAPAPVTPPPVTPAPSQPVAASADVAWCNANLRDTVLRSLVIQNMRDGVIDRTEMLGVFTQVRRDGTVSGNEFSDLQRVVGKSSFFAGKEYVNSLAADVVLGNAANARYQGTNLGNLTVGSSAAQLDKLVQKWFYGTDHPTALSGTKYVKALGSLFPHTPVYTDIRQGVIGDCYFLSSLGEVALRDPNSITSMFIVNGDSTYTVRFDHDGTPEYVTVDSMLPVNKDGNFVYANAGLSAANKNVPLWVALAEKAYAQMNESGWLRANLGDTGHNTYAALTGGYMFDALSHITGKDATYSTVDTQTFVTAFTAGKLITFASVSSPVDKTVVGNHGYAVVGYDQNTQIVTLFNPWGAGNSSSPAVVSLNWAQMKQNFFTMQYTV